MEASKLTYTYLILNVIVQHDRTFCFINVQLRAHLTFSMA